MTQNNLSAKKYKKAVDTLKTIYQMLKTKTPNDLHQKYINGILEELGEGREE